MTVYSDFLNLNATKKKQDAPGSLGTSPESPQSAEQEISILFQAATTIISFSLEYCTFPTV